MLRAWLILPLLLSRTLAAGAPAPTGNAHELSYYDFKPSVPLPRLQPMPPELLAAWRTIDQAPYAAYTPTVREAEILASAFAGLPAPMRKVLSERLIAVYLVKGLKGNGITDWVVDESSRTYAYIILNPAGFHQTLSQLLTERDRTLFKGPADLRVEAGDTPGILYTVAHESTHAFDYVRHVTPYTEPGQDPALAKSRPAWDVWTDYTKPKPAADYALRSKLHFYGFGEPELEPSQAPELCSQWAKSPFASLYGSRSWAEDLAELFVLRHLTADLRQPVRRFCGGKALIPWDNPKVRERALRLTQPLYR